VERLQLTFVAIHLENAKDRIIVFYPEEGDIGSKPTERREER